MSTQETVSAIMNSPEGLFFCPEIERSRDSPDRIRNYYFALMLGRGAATLMSRENQLAVYLQLVKALDNKS